MGSSLRNCASRLARVAVGVSLALFAGEGLVRVAAPQPKSWLEVYRRHPDLPFHALQPLVDQSASTGETAWTCRTDAMGFRCGAETGSEATRGVLWLGDSFAFGHGVDYEQCFVGRIEREAGRRVRHWNTAVPGYGPVQYEQLLRLHAARLEPAMVLACFYVGNDFHDCVSDKDVAVVDGVLGKETGLRGRLKEASHVYRLAAAAAHDLGWGASGRRQAARRRLGDADAWRRAPLVEAVGRLRDALLAMRDECAASGRAFAALVIPTREAVAAVRDPAAADGDPLRPVRTMVELLVELGIDHLDATGVLAELPAEQAFFEFDGHLTPLAHELVARALGGRWPVLVTGD